MEKEAISKNLEDITLYQYADVARRLASGEETAPFARGALEKLASSFEEILGDKKEILEGFKAGAFASEEGVANVIKIYSNKYQNALNDLDFNEFYTLREKIFTSLLGAEKAEEVKTFLDKYNEQTIGSVKKKTEQANAILKDKTGLFDDTKKEEAKKTIQKFQSIYTIIELIEQRNYEELKNSATKNIYKELLLDSLKKI